MNLPSVDQYLQIIEQKPPGSLVVLQNHRFISLPGGGFHFKKGLYALVFKTEHQSKFYAIRFFLDSEKEIFERYKQINEYLDQKPLPWKVNFDFLEKEIRFDGDYYPAVKMDWIDSISLSSYLDLIIHDNAAIYQLQQELINLSFNLEKNSIAHGNLNLHHLQFIREDGRHSLKLIDYDSMFIPAFHGKDSISAGTAGFQHPMRLASDFSEKMDRFSFWVFVTALEAFKTNPSFWMNAKDYGYNKTEQILFTYRDLAFPEQSSIFKILKSYNNEALQFYIDKLIGFCNSTDLNTIEVPKLYNQTKVYTTNKNPVVSKANEVVFKPQKKEEALVVQERPHKQISRPQESSARVEKTLENRPSKPPQREIEQEKSFEYFPNKTQKRHGGKVIFISGIIVALLASAYFIWQNQSGEPITENRPSTETPSVQEPVQKQATIFTSAEITQFLFQLYQSYNKRDLRSILSNYTDTVRQYYDASNMTKDQLSNVIEDLFIKPAYYECQPDLRTIKFMEKEKICTVSVFVTEIIQADRNSKKENYQSKIQYSINDSFKIVSEKNIE